MKIAVIGAGAMGSIFGGFLRKAGEEVWLIDQREELIETINEKGLTLSWGELKETLWPKSTISPAEIGHVDLVLFFVKSFDTIRAAQDALPLIGAHTYAMTLQNGIDNVSKIVTELGIDRVIYGTTRIGGFLREPGHVEVDHLSKDSGVYIGEWTKKRSQALIEVSEVFNRAGLPTQISDDIDSLLYKKLAVAASLGMLTAITGLRVSDLLVQEEGKELAFLVTDEVVKVANKKSIKLDLDETMNYILASPSGHITSMLKSVLNKEKLEVESINGAIVKEAEQLDVSAPVNKAITLLMRVIEKTYDRRVER